MSNLAEIKRWRAEQNPLRSKRMSKANLEKVDWLITALEQSQKREREARALVRKEADLYCTKDGMAGPLSDQWGWRDIGEILHRVADKLEPKPDTGGL